jgi:anti-sigma factor RsiW
LTCYRTRQRIGAWLDGALDEPSVRATAAHVERCPGCQGEAEALRRLRSGVRAMLQPPDPDWTGFWQGIVRGVEDGRRRTAPARTSRWSWRPQLALGGLVAAALLVTLTLWQTATGPFRVAEAAVVVSAADTDQPGGTLMVYSPPERDLAVVWVFEGAED